MLYFDRLEPMRDMSFEEIGQVFCAIWDYAETGTIPNLPQGPMMAWRMLRPNIDDGTIKYNETCIKNRYNRHRQEAKKNGTKAAEMREWWANQPDYTPELFKKESWYDEAAAAYQRLSALVNGGQRPSTVATNPSHSPIPGPGPNPSPGPGPNSPIDERAAAGERMKQYSQALKQKAREENYRSITSGAPARIDGK
jgi:hypothetical protein